MTTNLAVFMEKQLPLVDQEMLAFIKEYTTETSLLEAMDYSLQAGGKRIRPLLFLATFSLFQRPINKAHYKVAAALEMVHTYSLIHDDLPAMDNDDLRRGLPTNHKVYGEGLAILAGDGLLTEAFHLISKTDLKAESKILMIQELALAIGANGMIAGQVADIEGENQKLSLLQLQNIHKRKTGALIKAAVKMAGLLIETDPQTLRLIEKYGDNFGMAFQIRDDILDVIGNEEEIGKKIGSDEALNKSTYTSILGMEEAKRKLYGYIEDGLASLKQIQTTGKIQDISLLEQLLLKLG